MLILTGGAGFIGSNVLRRLNYDGERDILVVDDFSDGKKLITIGDASFVDCMDISEFARRKATLKGVTGIIHMGAISDTVFTNGRILLEKNFTASKDMLELAIEHRCPLIYASSASVYGNGTRGFVESYECEQPRSPYAASKLMFDNYVRKAADLRLHEEKRPGSRVPAPVVGLRFFNVYGMGEQFKGRMASFPYKCIRSLVAGEKIEIFEGAVAAARDYVSVYDVVQTVLFFLRASNYENPTGIYNVGTGVSTTFRQIAELAGATETDIVLVPFPPELQYGYQQFTKADLTKLQAAGYKYGFQTIESGMEQYKRQLTRELQAWVEFAR